MDNFLRGLGAEQLRFDEGWNATISVWRNGNYTWLKTNGKADASSVADMNTQVLLGALPVMARPRPERAFVIGFGSGTTVRTVVDAPDVREVDVVEIERAVLRSAPLFADVNQDVLADPRVRIIEDDARSALQLGGRPYDVIVSEPSNPWVAGVAGLFTPEFFGIIKSRLAHDGVFAQWVQMYRVDVGVIAVVVANLRQVFPHVEMWYANSADLVLLASNRPLTWDRTRIARFVEPGTPSAASMRDWLLIREPDDLLGRFVMGDRGTGALARQARFAHHDDRPALEFVAARGLIAASPSSGVFDSLFAIRAAVGDTTPALRAWPLGPGDWEWSYARALPGAARAARPLAERALAAAPDDVARRGEIGRFEHEAGRDSVALPMLREAARRLPMDARFAILAGSAARTTGDTVGAILLLERARAIAGGDSVLATSILAEWAVLREDYERGAAEATRAINALRPTLAMPFPGALQSAVQRLALEAPPPVAAPVLELAGRSRPGWDLPWWGGALVHARWGGEHCRRAAELASELGRFGWTDAEIVELLARCGRR
jgi:spermidine synthase